MKPEKTPEYLRWRAKAFSYRVKRVALERWNRPMTAAMRQRWEDETYRLYQLYGLPEEWDQPPH